MYATHQLCGFVILLSLCFLIFKNGRVTKELTSKNWHEDVAYLAQGQSFPVALITMAPVGFQPCQSPLPGLPVNSSYTSTVPYVVPLLAQTPCLECLFSPPGPPPRPQGSQEALFILKGLSQRQASLTFYLLPAPYSILPKLHGFPLPSQLKLPVVASLCLLW